MKKKHPVYLQQAMSDVKCASRSVRWLNHGRSSLSSGIEGDEWLNPGAPLVLQSNYTNWWPCALYTLHRDGCRVAEVEGARERRSLKGQGLLRKEGPPTYAILSRNLVLSQFTRFLKGFHRAFN